MINGASTLGKISIDLRIPPEKLETNLGSLSQFDLVKYKLPNMNKKGIYDVSAYCRELIIKLRT